MFNLQYKFNNNMKFFDEIKNDVKKNKIGFFLLFVILIFFAIIRLNLLNNWISPLYQSLIFILVYLLTLFFIMKPIVMSDEDKINVVEGWYFYYRFYTGVGYSTVSAGLVAIVVIKDIFTCIFIILMGLLFVIIGERKLSKLRKFKEESK